LADDDSNKDADEKKEEPKKASRVKAEKILEELNEGQNFEELAKKYSEDEANAEEGGDLGYFTKGTMEKEFEAVAFSLSNGKLSGIVETVYGYHIIKVTDKMENDIKPLEDVKEDIKDILLKKKSKKLAKRALKKILKSENPIKEFEKFGAEGPVVKRMTDFFGIKDFEVPPLGQSPKFKIAAFRLRENNASRLLEIDGRFYLLRLLEKKDSHILKLEEVKDEVVEALSLKEQEAMAKIEVDRLLGELKKGSSIDALAKEGGIETSHKDFFDRGQASTMFSMNKKYIAALFELKEKEFTVIPDSGEYHLVYMLERSEFDEEGYKKEKDGFLNAFLQEKQAKTMDDLLKNLRKKANVTINENIL
jgi:parvulin-like peptidyl-prolyl isomerase